MELIDREELMNKIETYEKHLIQTYKKTEEKKEYYRLMTLRKVKRIIIEMPKEREW